MDEVKSNVVDNFSDLDLSDDEGQKDDLELLFDSATNNIKKLVSKLDSGTLLNFYAYFKQATEGKCSIPRPGWYDIQGKQKWDAWNSLGNMPKSEAKKKYVNLMMDIDKNFNSNNLQKPSANKQDFWISVSTMSKEEDIGDTEKTVFELCQENNIDAVTNTLQSNKLLLDALDENGLGLIHWACDRGLCEMLKCLISFKCNVNLPDSCGQTALHYAASCGHQDCAEILLQNGALLNAEDSEGQTAVDVSCDHVIRKYLETCQL